MLPVVSLNSREKWRRRGRPSMDELLHIIVIVGKLDGGSIKPDDVLFENNKKRLKGRGKGRLSNIFTHRVLFWYGEEILHHLNLEARRPRKLIKMFGVYYDKSIPVIYDNQFFFFLTSHHCIIIKFFFCSRLRINI